MQHSWRGMLYSQSHDIMCNLCLVQVGCHGVLAEAAMRGHVSMVKTLCQKYHCDPVAAVKVQYTAYTGCSKRENL